MADTQPCQTYEMYECVEEGLCPRTKSAKKHVLGRNVFVFRINRNESTIIWISCRNDLIMHAWQTLECGEGFFRPSDATQVFFCVIGGGLQFLFFLAFFLNEPFHSSNQSDHIVLMHLSVHSSTIGVCSFLQNFGFQFEVLHGFRYCMAATNFLTLRISMV